MSYKIGQILYYGTLKQDEKTRKYSVPFAAEHEITKITKTFIWVKSPRGTTFQIRIADMGKSMWETSAITSSIRTTPEAALEVKLDYAKRCLANAQSGIIGANQEIARIEKAIAEVKDGK